MISLLALATGAPALGLEPPGDLPERVYLRTATASFNAWWYVVIRDGRLWIKPNEETGSLPPGAWQLLGETGLPEGAGLDRFDPPAEIVAISADGAHLHALSSDGVFYRGSDLRRKGASHSLRWTDRWGWPLARGPGLTEGGWRRGSWSVSDAHPFNVKVYEDVLGIEHSVGLGVAHVYRLDPTGTQIHYNDWWLPADWSRQLCGPQRGTVQIAALSASASTLLALDVEGRLWTRLWDHDTSCENDLLTCSYVLDGPAGTTRALPAEGWVQQPGVPDGRLTTSASIHQDGVGNTARVLRVEAVREGGEGVGFWQKRIDAQRWRWVQTQQLTGIPLDVRGPAGGLLPADRHLRGELSRQDVDEVLQIDVLDFNLICSPARVRLGLGGAPLTVGGEPIELALHHVHAQIGQIRPDDWAEQGLAGTIRGALLLDRDWSLIDDPDARALAQALFEDRRVLVFEGEATRDRIALQELRRGSLLRFPRAEKGRRGELFGLVAD